MSYSLIHAIRKFKQDAISAAIQSMGYFWTPPGQEPKPTMTMLMDLPQKDLARLLSLLQTNYKKS